MIGDKKDTVVDLNKSMRRLRELIEALDRREPHLEREGEIQIAHEAAELKQKALRRIAELELGSRKTPSGTPGDVSRRSSRPPALEEGL